MRDWNIALRAQLYDTMYQNKNMILNLTHTKIYHIKHIKIRYI